MEKELYSLVETSSSTTDSHPYQLDSKQVVKQEAASFCL